MKNKVDTIAELIAKTVFSPLVYMVEHDDRIDFVYITNEEISDDKLYDVQNSASVLLKCDVDILDIRYFSEVDKLTLLRSSKPIYCENPILPKLIETKAVESIKIMVKQKNDIIDRKSEFGCYFLQ